MLTPTLIITSTLCALAVVKASQPTTNNVTIDDQYGDKLTHRVPIFLPPDAWTHNSVAAILNPHRVHNGTWHDATHHPGDSARIVNFGFEGVALYVFCIIANMPPPSGRGFDSFADYQFLLDGDLVGEYKHAVEDTDDYFYNTPVYVNRTIPDAFHNFSIVVNSTEQAVLILFDYAIYTTLRILFLCFMTMAGATAEGLRNVTIDDRYGDEITLTVPTYLPPDAWSSRGNAQPNASLAYNRTWHDTTSHPEHAANNVTFNFTGVSLFVYCIIANTPPHSSQIFDAFANYTFFLDGELVGGYKHDVEQTEIFFYNVPVYVNQTMENKFHSFSIVPYSKEKPVLLLFDYAIYTKCEGRCVNASPSSQIPMHSSTPANSTDALPSTLPSQANTSEHHSSVWIIVAVTLAGAAVFILSGSFLFYRFRQANRATRREAKLWRQSRFIVQSKPRPTSETQGRGEIAEKLKGYSADTQTAASAVPLDSSIEDPVMNH
ncbi:hypothetical protein EYR38_008659 [Pleurotus pulmonarius]|nr:hypothetical protein EYR38_008659 [Pleurotus pulmonarius]